MRTPSRALVAACVALVVLGLAAAPALAQDDLREVEDQLVLSGRVVVRRGQAVGEVVVVNGTVVVGGVVRGDVVVISGRVEVLGQVAGDVVIFDGPVVLREGAFVGGDVVARGDVERHPAAQVEGRVRRDFPVSLREPAAALGRFALWVAVTVSTLALGLLLVLFAPRGLDATFRSARDHRWGSAGLGLAWAVGVPLFAVLLIVSLAGIPLGLSLLFGAGVLSSTGYALAAWLLGRWLVGPGRNRALTFAAGWALVRAIAVVPFAGFVTWVLGAAYGLGAATIAVWRARSTPAAEAPAWTGRSKERAEATGFEPAAPARAPVAAHPTEPEPVGEAEPAPEPALEVSSSTDLVPRPAGPLPETAEPGRDVDPPERS